MTGRLHPNANGPSCQAKVSRYGSISFNQNGREFPYGGINEAGLVIEQMMLESEKAQYPPKDDRCGLVELQWIQYQLDMAASVEEVVASDRHVRISDNSVAPIHFLAADARGNAAVIEYIGGRLVCYAGKDLPLTVSANDAYDDSLEHYAKMDAHARRDMGLPGGGGSTWTISISAAAAGSYWPTST